MWDVESGSWQRLVIPTLLPGFGEPGSGLVTGGLAISGDGSTVVAGLQQVAGDTSIWFVLRWVASGGSFVGVQPAVLPLSSSSAVSDDGKRILGHTPDGDLVVWREDGEMTVLGTDGDGRLSGVDGGWC